MTKGMSALSYVLSATTLNILILIKHSVASTVEAELKKIYLWFSVNNRLGLNMSVLFYLVNKPILFSIQNIAVCNTNVPLSNNALRL